MKTLLPRGNHLSISNDINTLLNIQDDDSNNSYYIGFNFTDTRQKT